MGASERLKLIALDADDLSVISAHVQDARVQAADIVGRQDEKRLGVGLNRPDWGAGLSGGKQSSAGWSRELPGGLPPVGPLLPPASRFGYPITPTPFPGP